MARHIFVNLHFCPGVYIFIIFYKGKILFEGCMQRFQSSFLKSLPNGILYVTNFPVSEVLVDFCDPVIGGSCQFVFFLNVVNIASY